MKFINFILFFNLLFIFNVNALDIRDINNAKIVSQASYKVNDTNLVDDNHAENLLDTIKDSINLSKTIPLEI